MEIKTFTVADLKAALLSEEFWLTQKLPITKHRALSYSHNPRAENNDTVLLVALQDNQIIGYLGILPDKIFVRNSVYKFGWMTSWWIDPGCKAKGAGAILLFKALNSYHQRLGVSGGSREARKVLQASQKFTKIKTLQGLNIRFRLNATGTFLRKYPATKILRAFFKTFDFMMDEIVSLRGIFWTRRQNINHRLSFEYIATIDEETGRFIQKHNQHDLTRKEKADHSWMMTYPWILSAPQKDSASKRYYFSSLSNRFNYLGVKVFKPNKRMIGFFILKVRDDRISVEYAYFENRHASLIIAAVVHHTLALDVSTLSLYEERLIAGFSELSAPHWSTKAVSRGFYLSNVLVDLPLTDCRLHGGEGDLAFY